MNRTVIANVALAFVGIASIVGTAIFAVNETPKAIQRLEEARASKHEELTKFETVQVATPAYKKTILTAIAGIVAIVASSKLSVAEIATLSTACAGAKAAFDKYRDKIVDIFGIDTDLKTRESISQEKHPIPNDITEDEQLYCYNDGTEDRFFNATNTDIVNAFYNLNKRLTEDGECSLSEFYTDLGIGNANGSELMGWNYDMACELANYGWIDMDYKVHESDDPDTPDYIEIFTLIDPLPGYDDDDSWRDEYDRRTVKYLKTARGV